MEELSINSYLKNGHEFHLYTYDEHIKAPKGTLLYDANEIVERKSMDENILLDVFRYQLLYLQGGWWANLDTICLKTFSFKANYIFSKILDYDNLSGIDSPVKLGTHIMKAPVSAGFLYDYINYFRLKGISNITEYELTSTFFNKVISNYNHKYYSKSVNTFNPFHYHEVYEFVKQNENINFNKKVFAITLWKEMWLKMKLDTNKTYHKNSIYEQLKRMYL